jgi:hypothetical protein
MARATMREPTPAVSNSSTTASGVTMAPAELTGPG